MEEIKMNNEEKRYDNAKIYCVSVRPLSQCYWAAVLYGFGAVVGVGGALLFGKFVSFICSLVGLELWR